VNLSVGLDVAGCATAGAENSLQVLLGSPHLDEWDSAGWMSGKVAPISVHLAHALNLGIAGSGLDHDNPLLLLLGADLTEAGLTLIGCVVVQHRYACDKLGFGRPVAVPRDARTICAREQQRHRTEAAGQGNHCWKRRQRRVLSQDA